MRSLAAITFLAPDYGAAVAWFRDALGFGVIEDRDMGGGKRWIVVAPASGAGARIIVAKATSAAQIASVGAAAGDRVAYFLQTDDFAGDYAAMAARGVRFLETPRVEDYGTVAVFQDPWGGKWDLIGRPALGPEPGAP